MALNGNIFEAKTLAELQSMGKLVEIRAAYKKEAEPLGVKGKTNSWDAMFESVKSLGKLLKPNVGSVAEEKGYDDLFFKSEAAKQIFFLTQLDGEIRMEKLGITKKHYTNKDLAAKWRNNILKIVHPDNCSHPLAAKATEQVNYYYGRMVQ